MENQSAKINRLLGIGIVLSAIIMLFFIFTEYFNSGKNTEETLAKFVIEESSENALEVVPDSIKNSFHKTSENKGDDYMVSIYARDNFRFRGEEVEFGKFIGSYLSDYAPINYYAIKKIYFTENKNANKTISHEQLFIYDAEVDRWIPISATSFEEDSFGEKLIRMENETMWTKGNDWHSLFQKEYSPYSQEKEMKESKKILQGLEKLGY